MALTATLVKIEDIKKPPMSDSNVAAGLLAKPFGFDRIERSAPPVTMMTMINPTMFQRMLHSQIANPFRKAYPQFTITFHDVGEALITVRAHYAHEHPVQCGMGCWNNPKLAVSCLYIKELDISKSFLDVLRHFQVDEGG